LLNSAFCAERSGLSRRRNAVHGGRARVPVSSLSDAGAPGVPSLFMGQAGVLFMFLLSGFVLA
jgi:hypothetical protein